MPQIGNQSIDMQSLGREITSLRWRKRCAVGAALVALALPPSVVAAEIFALHTDHAGSVIMETDENRNITWQGQYEPYGLPTQTTPEGPGYTGHVHDTDSGLVYMQQRYYDPQVGRFLSVDPVDVNDADGTNFSRYWYANNNPYMYVDPDGERAILLAAGVGAAFGGVFELRRQSNAGEPFNGRKVLAQAGRGAAIGVMATTGASGGL